MASVPANSAIARPRGSGVQAGVVLPSTLPSPEAVRLPKTKFTGADKTPKTLVRFEFRGPAAREVCLAGSFNAWQRVVMQKCDENAWSIYLYLVPGRHEYRFIVDDLWQEDPCATAQTPNPFGGRNSVLVVP